jgi:hypothetical protein
MGGVGEITRFASNGLALRTPGQVILLTSALVPEPSSIVLLIVGGFGLIGVVALRRVRAARLH